MAVFSFIVPLKIYAEYYWQRYNVLVVPNDHPHVTKIKVHDTIELHCDYQPGEKRNQITPIYRTVLYIGPGNVNDINFKYSIISFR